MGNYGKIIEVFKPNLIQHGKTMVLWKNYGTMEKNYDIIPKTMELWFTMEKTMVLWKELWYYSKL